VVRSPLIPIGRRLGVHHSYYGCDGKMSFHLLGFKSILYTVACIFHRPIQLNIWVGKWILVLDVALSNELSCVRQFLSKNRITDTSIHNFVLKSSVSLKQSNFESIENIQKQCGDSTERTLRELFLMFPGISRDTEIYV